MRLTEKLSVKIGNLLFRNAFFLYNYLYKIFKRRQDKSEIVLMRKYILPRHVILDVGANIGFYTSLFSELVGDSGKVHAFEPDPLNFEHLKKNISTLKNVQLYDKAVGDKNESIRLYRSPMLNVDHRTYPVTDYTEIVKVESITVDSLVKGNVDFIKIDIQGFEYRAFQGMQGILDRNPGIKIISEFYPDGLKAAGSNAFQFFDFFSKRGFRVFIIEKDGSLCPVTSPVFNENVSSGFYCNLFIYRDI